MRKKDKELTEISEIESIISVTDVCRIAFANDNTPYIVTMNFGYVGGKNSCLFFHCANEGRKLEMIRRNNYVCFEIDTDHEMYKGEMGCDWGMKYRSVVGYGKIFIVQDADEKIVGLEHIMNHYGGSGIYSFDEKKLAKTTVLRLDISEISGKKI
jgi:uncharacterized protein